MGLGARVDLRVDVVSGLRGAVVGEGRVAAEGSLEARHQEGRGDALAGDVADRDAEMASAELEEVVVIAGHAPGRAADAVAVERGRAGVLLWEEAGLHLLRDAHVALEPLLRGEPFALERALQLRDARRRSATMNTRRTATFQSAVEAGAYACAERRSSHDQNARSRAAPSRPAPRPTNQTRKRTGAT